jgi:hypothetical protein
VVEVEVGDEEALDAELRVRGGERVRAAVRDERRDRAHGMAARGEAPQQQGAGQRGAAAVWRQGADVEDARLSTHSGAL